MIICAAAAFAERTALREEIFLLDRRIAPAAVEERVRRRTRAVLGRFWEAEWAYEAPLALADEIGTEGARYVQFGWRDTVSLCEGTGATKTALREAATLLVCDCLATRLAIFGDESRSLPAKELWEVVKNNRADMQDALARLQDNPASLPELFVKAKVGPVQVEFYLAVIASVAGAKGEEAQRDEPAILAAFLGSAATASNASTLPRADPRADLARADALVEGGHLVEALALLGQRTDEDAWLRRLALDYTLRVSWNDYKEFLGQVLEPKLRPVLATLRSPESLSQRSLRRTITAAREAFALQGLPEAYDAALARKPPALSQRPHESLAAWRNARRAVGGDFYARSAGLPPVAVLVSLGQSDALSRRWVEHVSQLAGRGIKVAIAPGANRSPFLADLTGDVAIARAPEDLEDFRPAAGRPLLVLFGAHFLAGDALWMCEWVLGSREAVTVATEYLPAELAALQAIQFAYALDTPRAAIVGEGAGFDPARLLADRDAAMATLLASPFDKQFATVGLAPVEAAADEAPFVVVYDGEAPILSDYPGTIHAVAMDFDETVTHPLQAALDRLPPGLSERTPVLFLSQDFPYPPAYMRNAVTTFTDHEGRFDLAFLPIRQAVRGTTYVPVQRPWAGLVSLTCLASSCMALGRARSFATQCTNLSNIVDAGQQVFLSVPLFDPAFVQRQVPTLSRILTSEHETEPLPAPPDSVVPGEAMLPGLPEATRRFLAPIFAQRNAIIRFTEEAQTGDYRFLEGRSLLAILQLCREVMEAGRLAAARHILLYAIQSEGYGIAMSGELSDLMDLVIELGCQVEFDGKFRYLAAQIVAHQPSLFGMFSDIAAVAVSQDELDRIIISAAGALRDNRRTTGIIRVLTAAHKYASPSTVSWVLLEVFRNVRAETLKTDEIRAVLRGLWAASDLDGRAIGLPAIEPEVMSLLRAAPPANRLQAVLAEGDFDAAAAMMNAAIAADRPLLELVRQCRTYSHELSEAGIAAKVAGFRFFDTPEARMVFAGVVGDEDYIRQHLPPAPLGDVDVICRSRLGALDWLAERLDALGGPIGVATPRFRTGSLADFFASVMEARGSAVAQPDGARPRVSVAMTVLDPDPALLRLAADSILGQEGVEVELILIDDGSGEEGAAAIRAVAEARPGIIFERFEENRGPYLGRNRALELATGAFFAIHDGDDVAHPARLLKQVEALEAAGPQAMLATSWHIRVDAGGKLQFEHHLGLLGDGTMTSVFRREAFERVGAFVAVRSRGDVEMRERIRSALGEEALVHLDYPMVFSNAAPTTLSNRTARNSFQFLQLFRSSFARRHRHLRQAIAIGERVAPPDTVVPVALRP